MSRSIFLSLTLLLAAALAPPALGQDASDLYLVPVEGAGDAASFGEPIRLTNRDGYDNQPSFSADGSRVFYTSMRGEQTDIWQIDVSGSSPSAPRPLFETPESEYSPTPIPCAESPCPEAISVIRVEADGRQRLWRLPMDENAQASVILPDIEPVGYQAWSADGRELVLFVLDEPHRLVRVSLDQPGKPRTVSADIGRSLHRIPGQETFSFIDKSGGEGWRVASLSIDGDRLGTLAPTLETREDVAFVADGSLFGGDGTRLLRGGKKDSGEKGWQEVADFGRWGVSGITRLAFHAEGTHLALVAQRQPEKARRLDIVDRAIAHHGGELFRNSETTLKQCSKSGCSEVVARMQGDAFTYDVSGPRRGQTQRVRATNETLELWRDGAETPVGEEDVQGLRNWAMARTYFAFLPFRLNDPSVWKQYLGEEVWGGRSLYKVRVTFDAGSSSDADDVYLYWFDTESAELVQFAYSYAGNPGGLRFRRLENPRRVGGLLFHDQKNYGAEGEGLRVERLTPESVRLLRLVSSVTFKDIAVRPISEP